ncbi:MAG: OmpA family protein [Ignavibacteria bacterium]|nr:OmpA family protein [Ignavibacteria bacterium]
MKNSTLFLFSIFFLLSCATEKIVVRYISESKEIELGDTATVSWHFGNAVEVKIPIFSRVFKPQDSVRIAPRGSLRLDIYAYDKRGDSIYQSVYIFVNPRKQKVQVDERPILQRGPLPIPEILSVESNLQSEYFSGFSKSYYLTASNLKIFGVHHDQDTFKINFGILDQFGNMLQNVGSSAGEVSLEASISCRNGKTVRRRLNFPSSLNYKGKSNFYILVDYSLLFSEPNLHTYLVEGLKYFESGDKASVVLFGVVRDNIIPLQVFDRAYWELKDRKLTPKLELSSIYKSLVQTLEEIDERDKNQIILLTNQTDNSSITYTIDDVLTYANSKKVPIYIIGFGNEISYSTFNYISAKTGALFYHILFDKPKVVDALREILLSTKYSFSISIPNDLGDDECRDINLKITARFPTKYLSSEVIYPLRSRDFYVRFQAVALFSYLNSSVGEEYKPLAESLAQLLTQHRDMSLELIGHSSLQETMFNPTELSLNRAIAVKNLLLDYGVNPKQVKIKGYGASKPLYLNEDDEIARLLNRRVEIRWLHPSVLPYTIVVDTTVSEELAEKRVDFWKSQGFKAYYDRFLMLGKIQYKVILWGYSDYHKAENDAKKILRRYKKYSIVE